MTFDHDSPERQTSSRSGEIFTELDGSEEEIEQLPGLAPYLQSWQAPVPAMEDTKRLVTILTPLLPGGSPVRRSLQSSASRPPFVQLMGVVAAQVSVLQPSFWLGSAAALLLGIVLVLGAPGQVQSLFLYVLGPILSFLAADSAFRSDALSVRELELSCLPSARQLTLARLIAVLGYQVGLGLLLSIPLWAWGGQDFLVITLRWLAPLLLILGLTLLLSLRVSLARAVVLVYTAWITGLVATWETGGARTVPSLSSSVEIILLVIGLGLLAVYVAGRPAVRAAA